MLAGEVVYRNRDRLSRATVVALATVAPLAGTVQFLAWYLNGRRAAFGTGGPLLFLSDPEWEPPPWLVAVDRCGGLRSAPAGVDVDQFTQPAALAPLADRRPH